MLDRPHQSLAGLVGKVHVLAHTLLRTMGLLVILGFLDTVRICGMGGPLAQGKK